MANIVLIHGLWMTPLSWEGWKQRFESRGHNVVVPGWPGIDDRDVASIRQDPSALEGLGVTQIVDHYDAIIRGLDAPPIIMGHSFGGLVTQLLLDRDLGSAGVAIGSAPIKGILGLPYSSLKVATWGGLKNPFGKNKTVMLTPKQFRYAFTNTLDDAEAAEVYERLPIPGPARTLFQAGLANFTPGAASKVNLKNDDRAPLLVIGGGKDHISPASVARATYKLQGKSKAKTELKEYPDRSHYIVAQRGWEEVADYALDWATANAKGGAAA